MKFGSLFTGIGGFDLGLEWAGMTCAWQVENDRHCQKVLRTHWPDVPKYQDVKDVGRTNLEPVDLICGGFPCQDLSVAGKRQGLAGERSGLWRQLHRLLSELLPQYVLIENVPGLLSSHKGRDMGILLGSLAQLGYGWVYRVLDAQYFGVPQRRRRVFIVGYLGDWQRAAQILFEPESGQRHPAPRGAAGEGITAPLTGVPYADHESQEARLVPIGFNPRKTTMDTYENLSPTMHPGNGGFQSPAIAFSAGQSAKAGSIAASETTFPTLKAADSGTNRVPAIAFGGNNTQGEIAVSTAINAHPSRRYDFESETFIIKGAAIGREPENRPQYGEVLSDGSVYTLNATETHAVANYAGVRRLTPLECERLQGFPDGWTAGQADTQRYRQLGNAVAVPVAEWIGRRFPHETTPE